MADERHPSGATPSCSRQVQHVLPVTALGGQHHEPRAVDGPETWAQSRSTRSLTLQKLLRQPKVTWPFSRPAAALTAGSLVSGS